MVYCRGLGSLNRRITYLHFTLKGIGILALILALFSDRRNAHIYVAGMVALATSHKLIK